MGQKLAGSSVGRHAFFSIGVTWAVLNSAGSTPVLNVIFASSAISGEMEFVSLHHKPKP